MSASLFVLALLGASPHTPADPASQPAATSQTASATPELGDDLVRLKSGGRIRGQVVESVPDSHVIVLVLGEQRRIEWVEVEAVEEGHFAKPEPKPEPAPAAEPEPTDTRGAPFVTLRSTGRRPLQLQQIEREGMGSGWGYGGMYSFSMTQWRSVCSEPCERRIDGRKGETFVVGDHPLTFSKKISLEQEQGDIVIEGRPGSKAARVLGAVGLGLGIGLAISSPLMLVFDGPHKMTAFGVMLGAGGAFTVAGTFGLVYGRARVRVHRVGRS